MRKLTAIAVVMVLILTMIAPTFASAATDYGTVKVKLSSMGSPSSVQFKVAGAYRVAENSSVDLFPGITYTAKAEGSGITLSYHNGTATVTHSLPATITLNQYTNGTSKNFLYVYNPTYGWRYYSGNMTMIRASGTSYLQLINAVYIETYLYGVVAYEMSNDWPAEALKAQAIAARTYALTKIKANPSATYHLVDTSLSQVYKGYPYLTDNTPAQNVINAVNATAGKALLSGNPALLNFATGEYSASNGGQIRGTATSDDYDIRNVSSPYFTYIFPKSTAEAVMGLLSSADRAKANTMLALIKEKLPAALLAQQGIACTANDIVINGIAEAEPTALRTGMPVGSREFSKVSVTVNVTVNGVPAPAPAIEVSGNGTVIADGDTTPAIADNTDFGSIALGSGAVTKTYTIKNTGNAALTVTGITLATGDTGDFAVGGQTFPLTVAAGASADFTVAFTPSVVGPRSTKVTIASNEAGSPFEFQVQGTGAAGLAPSIEPSASLAPSASAGGGGMPAGFTGTVTVLLDYVSQAGDGDWDVFGELRTRFTSYSSMLSTTSLWLLYDGATSDANFLTVTARGYGHGRGMSQRGAQQMAKESKTVADILSFYYAGYTSASVGITPKALTQIPGNGSSAQWGKVTASTLNVRAAASTSGTLVGTLAKSTIIEIIGTSGSWYKVLQGSTGLVGYVSSQYITKTTVGPTATPAATATPTASPTATVTASASASPTAASTPAPTAAPTLGRVVSTTLNMRSSTTTTSTIVYTLKKGDNVVILGTPAANWYKVRFLSYVGYCMYQSGTTIYIDAIGTGSAVTPTPSPSASATASPSFSVSTVSAKPNITSGSLILRASASTTSSKLTEIPKGSTFTVVQVHTDATWLKATYSGKTGYVMAKYAIIGGSTAYKACTVTASQLNVRSGAGTNYSIIGTLRAGDTLVVTATTGTWYKVQSGSNVGYIDSQYARISK